MLPANLKMALEFQDLRLEAVPESRSEESCRDEAESHDGEISRDAVRVHFEIEPAEVDEDSDVDHVEAVADAAIEGERTAAKQSIDWIARAGGCDGRQNGSAKGKGECRVEECGAACDGGGASDAENETDEAAPEPYSAGNAQRVEAEGDEAAEGDAVEMDERVGRCDPVWMREAHERAGDEYGEEQRGEYSRGSQKTEDGRTQEVVLLFDGQGPGLIDGGWQREVKQVLKEKQISPPGSDAKRSEDGQADEPWRVEIAHPKDEEIDRPDAQGTTGIEVAEVFLLVARLKQDGSNQKAG